MTADKNLLSTAKEALANGDTYYFTGKPCKHGHTSKRKARDSGCYECGLELTRQWAKGGNGYAATKKWNLKNRDKHLQYKSEWAKANRAKETARQRAWRDTNPDKYQANNKAYYKENRAEFIARARERGSKVAMDLRLLSPEEQQSVKELYATATRLTEETGVEYEVDHILPLSLGGAHAPYNLQVITKAENRSKRDTFRQEDKDLYSTRVAALFNQ